MTIGDAIFYSVLAIVGIPSFVALMFIVGGGEIRWEKKHKKRNES